MSLLLFNFFYDSEASGETKYVFLSENASITDSLNYILSGGGTTLLVQITSIGKASDLMKMYPTGNVSVLTKARKYKRITDYLWKSKVQESVVIIDLITSEKNKPNQTLQRTLGETVVSHTRVVVPNVRSIQTVVSALDQFFLGRRGTKNVSLSDSVLSGAFVGIPKKRLVSDVVSILSNSWIKGRPKSNITDTIHLTDAIITSKVQSSTISISSQVILYNWIGVPKKTVLTDSVQLQDSLYLGSLFSEQNVSITDSVISYERVSSPKKVSLQDSAIASESFFLGSPALPVTPKSWRRTLKDKVKSVDRLTRGSAIYLADSGITSSSLTLFKNDVIIGGRHIFVTLEEEIPMYDN